MYVFFECIIGYFYQREKNFFILSSFNSDVGRLEFQALKIFKQREKRKRKTKPMRETQKFDKNHKKTTLSSAFQRRWEKVSDVQAPTE